MTKKAQAILEKIAGKINTRYSAIVESTLNRVNSGLTMTRQHGQYVKPGRCFLCKKPVEHTLKDICPSCEKEFPVKHKG